MSMSDYKYIGSVLSNDSSYTITTSDGTNIDWSHNGYTSTTQPYNQSITTTTTDTWTTINWENENEVIKELRQVINKLIDKSFKKKVIKDGQVCLIKVPNQLFQSNALQKIVDHIEKRKIKVVFIPEQIDKDNIKFISEKYITDEILLAMKLNE